MALNPQIFKTRAISAVVFAVVMVAGLLVNSWSFLLLFSIIHFGCWMEYLRLGDKIHGTLLHIYMKLGFMLVGFGMVLWICGDQYFLGRYDLRHSFSLPVSAAGFVFLIMGLFRQNQLRIPALIFAAKGLLYLSISLGLFFLLKNPLFASPAAAESSQIYMVFLPFWLILVMWINDTMAYLVGSLIGRHPFSKISPKKTWEGTIGGVLLAALITGFAGYAFDSEFLLNQSLTWWVLHGFCVAIAGTLGDLFESWLKRRAGVKDSGKILPGHGGFLDRFDSLLLAIPASFLYILLTAARLIQF